MLLKEAIANYLLFLQHEQGASVNTIRSYCLSLRRFLCRMGAQRFVLPHRRISLLNGIVVAELPQQPALRAGSHSLEETGLQIGVV